MEEVSSAADLPREKWDTWDPMLISEGLFSAANIFSSLKLVYIFSVNPHLGPLQVSPNKFINLFHQQRHKHSYCILSSKKFKIEFYNLCGFNLCLSTFT